ncbi:hypothetical protein JCM33374_g5260 [Metschnikowia sp. JCM 33374]|nr:hypothetical protein JCM33374_g5260 [Metschnikowia sp. JCM 33374]
MSNIEQLFFLLKTHNFKTDGLENYLSDSPLETKTDGTTKDDSHWEYAFEVIVENQRGIKFLGIPLFSGKSLLPLVDPPMYQRLDGVKISLAHESMSNYPLRRRLDWSWPSWYVLMLHDVDEAGWVYSPF